MSKPRDNKDKWLRQNFADADPKGVFLARERRLLRKLWKRARSKRNRADDKRRLREEG